MRVGANANRYNIRVFYAVVRSYFDESEKSKMHRSDEVSVSTRPISASRSTQGVILMVVAMFTIPLVDGLAKYLSASYSPLFISWARYAFACLIVLPIIAAKHGSRLFPSERRASHIWRTIFLVTAMNLYFLAIARIPLATAVSTYFIGPIVAVVLSVVILKERMTSRKAMSLILGFVGSMVILQPGGAVDPGILLALGSGISFAFYMIATRHAAQNSNPIKTLAFQCVVGMLILTPQAVLSWSTPAWNDLIFFVGMGLFSAVGHGLSIAAFRLADASTLAPLVYIELISTALIGYLAFKEVPGTTTLIGAGLIIVAGLFLLQRKDLSRSEG
jgi:drug/metabolite transporter (DMT)-like permease